MRALNNLILFCSRNAWLFLLTTGITFGCLFAAFFPMGVAFAELTGGEQMFDFQNTLTVEQIFAQLPNYTPGATQLYYAFSFVDYFFPFFAGLFLAALAAFGLRHFSPGAYDWVTVRNLWPLLMIGTAFDWAENCFALTVISQYPQEAQTAAALLVLAKQGKLASILVAQFLGWSLLVLGLGRLALQRLSSRSAG